jgi:transcriptional regulator with XRE-family HTH domain
MKINRILLKQLRLQRALSQEELAIASGISTRTVQRMEAVGTASLESQKAVAAVFGIYAEQLLGKPDPSHIGGPMKVIASSALLVAATVLFTFFGIAEAIAPVNSLDSRDVFVGSWIVAALALAILALRELRLLNSQVTSTPA